MSEPEPDFQEHKTEMIEAVNNALNQLAEVRAYTLTAAELQDFKAAQYALRNLSPDKGNNDVEAVYDE